MVSTAPMEAIYLADCTKNQKNPVRDDRCVLLLGAERKLWLNPAGELRQTKKQFSCIFTQGFQPTCPGIEHVSGKVKYN